MDKRTAEATQIAFAALQRAATAAEAAGERGYCVRQTLTPKGVRTSVRIDRDGRAYEVLRDRNVSDVCDSDGKILIIDIETGIAEVEAYLFGLDLLPRLQANYRQSVENACFFFYQGLETSSDISYALKYANWHYFAEAEPEHADAIRRAMKSAMRGGRPSPALE